MTLVLVNSLLPVEGYILVYHVIPAVLQLKKRKCQKTN